jgi:hypothetical protein
LGREEKWTVVDVGGRPVGPAAERRLQAEHQRHFDEGIRALLRQDYEAALRALDLAAALFERSLAGQRDHGPRYGALVAKAAVLIETGRKEAARQVLRELAALQPGGAAPTRETQSEAVVALYEEVLRDLGPPGLLRFEGESSGIRLRLDGRDLGDTPFAPVSLAPGRHLIAIRTATAQRVELIEIRSGEERSLRLPGEGPEERHRSGFLEDVTFRPARVGDAARKISKLAEAQLVLVAWVRKEDGEPKLYLGRLDATGRPENIGRVAVSAAPGAQLRALVTSVLDPKRSGGFEVLDGGKLAPSERLAQALGDRDAR